MIYKKEPITNRIISFESEASIGAGFVNWVILTESEILAYELQEAKTSKISQLKSNRDAANTAPMSSHQAEEILVEDYQNIKTGEFFYFIFTTKSTNNPATEPSSIINAVLRKGVLDPDYYIRYSCAIIDGQTIRKGYIALDYSLANSISNHAEERNTNNILVANIKEEEIKACTTIEELNAINIEF